MSNFDTRCYRFLKQTTIASAFTAMLSAPLFLVPLSGSRAAGQAIVPTFNASTTPTFVSIFSKPAFTEPPIPMLFRTGVMNDREQGSAIADYVVDHLGAKKVALVSQSDEYGKRGGEAVVT